MAHRRPVEGGEGGDGAPELRQPLITETGGDVIEQLRKVLVEKIREIPATELDVIREYIREIKRLGGEETEGD